MKVVHTSLWYMSFWKMRTIDLISFLEDVLLQPCYLYVFTFATVHVVWPSCPPYSIIWRVWKEREETGRQAWLKRIPVALFKKAGNLVQLSPISKLACACDYIQCLISLCSHSKNSARPGPTGINKSIKTWFKMPFTGCLDTVMWFGLARCDGFNIDGTIFDRGQLVE